MTTPAPLLLCAPPSPLLLPAWCGSGKRRVVAERRIGHTTLPLDTVTCADALVFLRGLPSDSVNCVVTSPPYFGLRDYGVDGQMGLENSPTEFVAGMVALFRECRRVLRSDGTLWVNIGDSYAQTTIRHRRNLYDGVYASGGFESGHQSADGLINNSFSTVSENTPPKSLLMIPARLAIAMQDDGWILRSDIVWHKPNPMPESVRDRCTKAHEYVFLLSKSERYFYDHEAVKEPAAGGTSKGDGVRLAERAIARTGGVISGGTAKSTLGTSANEKRNRRSVWSVATRPYKGAHFAVFPPALIEPCILAGSRPGDIVLDPFFGSGTTGAVALKHGRQYIGCELNQDYKPLQDERIAGATLAQASLAYQEAPHAA